MKKIDLFKWFRKMPIGNKITFIYAGFFSLVMIILSAFIMFNTFYYYKDISKKELDETVNKVAEHIKSGGATDSSAIDELNSNKALEIKVTTESEMSKRRHDMDEMMKNKPKEDFPPPKIDDGGPKPNDEFEMGTIKGKQYMSIQKVVNYNNENYIIQVFRPYYQEQRILRIIMIIFIISNILGIFCAFLIGKFISKKLLKPVVEISDTAQNISINDLSQRITVPEPNDEIRNLAITFNDMISRLEGSIEKQKQFISDASHELRTPISVIQGYANLIDRWGKSDTEILDESIDSIKTETEHMSNLINKLLFLARAEKNAVNIKGEKICLNSVFEDIVKEVNLTREEIDISVSENEELFVMADLDMLKQTIWVFLDNAIKYSNKENIIIKIKLYKEDNYAVFEIADNGIGIKEEDLPYIFDRFYRGDKSRSKETPGTGLGLSIAYRIIDGHNGKVDVKSTFGEGTTFIVALPILKESEEA